MAEKYASNEYLTGDGSVEGDGARHGLPGDVLQNFGAIVRQGEAGVVPPSNCPVAVDRFRQILRLSSFYHKEPGVWFAEIELLFDYAGVSTQKSKTGAVLVALDCETVMTASDITRDAFSPDIYSLIKHRLISSDSVSSASRLRQLLKAKYPARAYYLSRDKCSNEVIKAFFLDQLSSHCRSALALS